MKLHRRPISKHQRARLIAWTLAMLMWLASVLAGAAFHPRHERQRAERMSLAYLTRRVKLLIVSRAIDFMRLRPNRRIITAYRGRPVLRDGQLRALAGSRIARLLKRRCVLERVLALLAVLLDLDAHANSLAKRLKHGLTRRWPILLAPAQAAPLITLAAPDACFADSS